MTLRTLQAIARRDPLMRWLVLASMATVPTLAGCGSQDATGPQGGGSRDLTGTYSLSSVDGARLPATVYEGPWVTGDGRQISVHMDATSSTLNLDSNNRFQVSVQLTVTGGGDTYHATFTDQGIYERNGTELVFTSDDPDWATYFGDTSNGQLQVGIDIPQSGDPPAYAFHK